MVSQGIEATHPILAVVSRLALDIYPTLLHVVSTAATIEARNSALPRSYRIMIRWAD